MMEFKVSDGVFATWLYRLLQSAEWPDAIERYKASMIERAMSGAWAPEKVAEFARDLQGARAFALWMSNEVNRKDGAIDGRAKRYAKQRTAQGEGGGAI